MADFNNLRPGENVDIPVERSGDYKYFSPDNVIAGQAMSGAVELSFLGLRNAWVAQTFLVESDTAEVATMAAQRVSGRPSIVELATLKLTPALAVDVLSTLAQHLVRFNLSTEAEVTARVAAGIEAAKKSA